MEAGLTQLQLAAEIGKSRDTILNVEKEPDLVTLETCNVCALACGVDPATLYDDRLAFLSDAPARIRDIRKNHQLTQDGLAKKIGVSRTTIKITQIAKYGVREKECLTREERAARQTRIAFVDWSHEAKAVSELCEG